MRNGGYGKESTNKRKKRKKEIQAIETLNCAEQIDRYGQANEEYIKAYTGYEWANEKTGQHGFAKGHKQIAQSKINPKYKEQNYKQQAGFSAEVDIVAKTNAENIIQGKSDRVRRSNDVGRGNDTQIDIGTINGQGDYIIDANGKVSQGIQIKFSGKTLTEAELQRTAKTNVNRMRPKGKWGRYDNIGVPAEQYEPMRQYAKNESIKARQRAADYRKRGNIEQAQKCEQTAREYESCYHRIKNTEVTSKEAMFARKHPVLHTAKRIGETSHQAGLEQMPSSALISGAVTAAQGVVAVARGEKSYADLAKEVAVDSAAGAIQGYGTTFAGATLKGVMSASSHQVVKNLAKTNAPGLLVSGIYGTAKSFRRYIHGDINELELAESIGENGIGIVASSWGATAGTMVMPGIGTVVGGLAGSMVSAIIYQGAMKTLHKERLSNARRIQVEKWAREAERQLKKENQELRRRNHSLHLQREQAFTDGLNLLVESEKKNNVTAYLQGIQQIVQAVGGSISFHSERDIDNFMRDPTKKLQF